MLAPTCTRYIRLLPRALRRPQAPAILQMIRSADSGKMPEQHALLAESKRQEVLQLDNEIVFNEAIIEEREQSIQDIQQQIGEVNEVFKDLVTLVHAQGVIIAEHLEMTEDVEKWNLIFKIEVFINSSIL